LIVPRGRRIERADPVVGGEQIFDPATDVGIGTVLGKIGSSFGRRQGQGGVE
jgi:hypothetical protein